MKTTGKRSRQATQVSRRAERRIQERRAARQRQLQLLGVFVVIALVAVVALILANRDTGPELPAVVAAAELPAGVPVDGRTMGNPDAPVTVVEWGDYQCPGCAQFARGAAPRLIEEFVVTGKVRFEYRDYAFLGEESVRAAEAAACALDQGKFWEYHDTIFVNHHGENAGAYSPARLKQMGEVLGLDMDTFGACVDNRTHREEIARMAKEARELGIFSTPSLVINGEVVPYRGYDDLKARIEAELGS